jgi:hypothetical protein
MERTIKRRLLIGATAALVAGSLTGITSPALAASVTTGQLTVMLMTPAKQRLETPNVGILLTNSSGDELVAQTDASGEAVFTQVPAGNDWTVTSTDDHPAGYFTRVDGTRTGVTVTAGVHSWVVSVARYGAVIHGGVYSSDGGGINLAKVSLYDSWSHKTFTTWTNSAGRYQFIGLQSGDDTVTFTAPHHGTLSKEEVVHAEYGANPNEVAQIDATLLTTF